MIHCQPTWYFLLSTTFDDILCFKHFSAYTGIELWCYSSGFTGSKESTENPHITIKCSAGRSDSKRDIVQDNDIVHMEILFL